MREPRQHHILPAFYLTGFTDTGTRKGRVHVFDYRQPKRYWARPDTVAHERDYYRMYEPDQDEYAIEKALAQLEDKLAAVLQEVVARGGRIQKLKELGTLLSLAALLYARGRM